MVEKEFICNAKVNSQFFPIENGVFFGGCSNGDDIFFCSINGFPEKFFTARNGTWKANKYGVYYREVPGGREPHRYMFFRCRDSRITEICKSRDIFWAPLGDGAILFSGEQENGDRFYSITDGGYFSGKKVNYQIRNMRYFFTHDSSVYFEMNGDVVEYNTVTDREKVICKLLTDPISNTWTAFHGEVYQQIYDKGRYSIYYLGNSENPATRPILITIPSTTIFRWGATPNGLITSEGKIGGASWELYYYPKPI